MLVFICVVIAYRRKSTESSRVLKSMQEHMDMLELQVRFRHFFYRFFFPKIAVQSRLTEWNRCGVSGLVFFFLLFQL